MRSCYRLCGRLKQRFMHLGRVAAYFSDMALFKRRLVKKTKISKSVFKASEPQISVDKANLSEPH